MLEGVVIRSNTDNSRKINHDNNIDHDSKLIFVYGENVKFNFNKVLSLSLSLREGGIMNRQKVSTRVSLSWIDTFAVVFNPFYWFICMSRINCK